MLIVGVALAGEDRTHDPLGHETIAAMHQVLIENGKCGSRNDCTVKQYVFFASSSSGLDFEVYGVTEKAIVPRLIAILSLQDQKLPIRTKLVAKFIQMQRKPI